MTEQPKVQSTSGLGSQRKVAMTTRMLSVWSAYADHDWLGQPIQPRRLW